MIERRTLNCTRCGHTWFSSKVHPCVCPRCHSPLWFLEKKQQFDKVSKHAQFKTVPNPDNKSATQLINELDRTPGDEG